MTKPIKIIKKEKPETILKNLHSMEGKLAEKITKYSGSMPFVYLHATWFITWFVINQGFLRPYIQPFDTFPYGLLTMVVSLEAIFLSTFIMVAQNRQALIDEYRDIEEDIEEREAEEEVEDIQQDLDDLKSLVTAIQKKIVHSETNGNKKK